MYLHMYGRTTSASWVASVRSDSDLASNFNPTRAMPTPVKPWDEATGGADADVGERSVACSTPCLPISAASATSSVGGFRVCLNRTLTQQCLGKL